MPKNKKPKIFKISQNGLFKTPYSLPKEQKQDIEPHIMTEYEFLLIQKLKPAIESKQLIKFWYEDTTTNFSDWRIVEPHLIGQTNYKHEKIWLVAWFLPTSSQISNGHAPDWKTYILDNVKKLEILEDRYKFTKPNYNIKDKRMKTIYCATSYYVQ